MHLNWSVQMATALTFANQFSQTKAIVSQVNWYQSAANPNLRHPILRPGEKWKRSSKKVTQLSFWNRHKTDLKPFFEVAIDALPSMQTMIRSINLSLSLSVQWYRHQSVEMHSKSTFVKITLRVLAFRDPTLIKSLYPKQSANKNLWVFNLIN